MAQTSYSATQPIGIAGQLADLSVKRVVTSVNMESVGIPFGIGVTSVSGGHELPDAGGDKIHGIVVHSHNFDQRDLTGTDGVPAGAVMNVLTEGVVVVKVEDAVLAHGDVYCRHTANGAGKLQLGAFRSDADTANAGIVKGAKFRTGASGSGLAEIEFSKLVNLS